MFDHVTIRASDPGASERFYDVVLAAIGSERDDFSLAAASAERPVTRGLHIGFGARSREDVDAFWRAGMEAGFASDGEPGPRPIYCDDYYGGFLLDPDGNSVEAVNFEGVRLGVDHLWIRVADVQASKRFYETIAPHAGFKLGTDTAERVSFNGEPGSLSVLAGDHVTENLQIAFPAAEDRGALDPDGNSVELVSRYRT